MQQERCHYRQAWPPSHLCDRRDTLATSRPSQKQCPIRARLALAPSFQAHFNITVSIAYITHPTCHLHDMGPYHPECPQRLDAIHDHLISAGLDAVVAHYDAPAATREQLERVHSVRYIDEVEAASPQSGIHYLDPDTALNPDSLEAARHAAGAVVLDTDLVVSGECSAAFCAVA